MLWQKWKKAKAEAEKARIEVERAKAEAQKASLELEAAKLARETQANSRVLLIYADAAKVRKGTHDIEFSESELRNALRKDAAPRLHAVLDLLTHEGKARKADTPGYWIIE